MSTNYPFIRPSDDIEYLFADAYVNFEDPADYDLTKSDCSDGTLKSLLPPYRVAWFYRSTATIANSKPSWAPTPVNNTEVLIVDRKGRIVFDSTKSTTFHEITTWHPSKAVYEWIYDQNVCRLVVHTAWPFPGLHPGPRTYNQHITPSNGELDPIVATKQPKRLKSFVVGLSTLQKQRVVEFANGYNMEITAPGQIQNDLDNVEISNNTIGGGRAGWRLSFDGAAGGGLGRYDGCVDISLAIRTINRIKPDDYSNFYLEPEGCYWWSRPYTKGDTTTTITTDEIALTEPAHTIKLHNDCSPCCPCEDFVEVKQRIDNAWADWQILATQSESIRDVYKENRARILSQKICRESKVHRVDIQATISGFVGIAYQWCNTSQECAGPVTITLTLKCFESDGDDGGSKECTDGCNFTIVPTTPKQSNVNGVMKPIELEGTGPWEITFTQIDACSAGTVTFMLRANGAICGGNCYFQDGDSLEITGTAAGLDDAIASVSIRGDEECPDAICTEDDDFIP